MTDRDRRQPEAPGCHESLVAVDDRPVLPSRQDGLDEAELAEASLERVELVIADAARVGRVRAEVVDGDVLDGDGGARWSGSSHCSSRRTFRPRAFMPFGQRGQAQCRSTVAGYHAILVSDRGKR
jgi:hypothetical protein